MILLENENVKVSFVQKGAELKSLIHKPTKQEYMWAAEPEFWAKTSPVLFPIVGALKGNTYTYKNKNYTLGRHGFARDRIFDLQQISDGEVLFTLQDTADTWVNYPFKFNLGIRYHLSASSLSCTYEIFNPGTEELLFSIGGHPAFAVPLQEQEQYGDYYLQFNKDEALQANKIVDNLIADETTTIALAEGRLALNHGLFYEDALVFKNLKSDRIALLNSKNIHGLGFSFKDFPYFGIWSARDADFVCLEPWCGIADGIYHDGLLENKEGIEKLMPQSTWKRTWEIDVF
ncbi:aldose 1-epimerase family protein [Pedobacter immunditicola]|uniref:aldose 1-epimerase family protein n=1 Tax=Pedobacter immunditicola TaxID=3133440 RepID=UPI0030B48E07